MVLCCPFLCLCFCSYYLPALVAKITPFVLVCVCVWEVRATVCSHQREFHPNRAPRVQDQSESMKAYLFCTISSRLFVLFTWVENCMCGAMREGWTEGTKLGYGLLTIAMCARRKIFTGGRQSQKTFTTVVVVVVVVCTRQGELPSLNGVKNNRAKWDWFYSTFFVALSGEKSTKA